MTNSTPRESWYKTKKVIAACLDIGRTLSREIAGIAIVTDPSARVVWHQAQDEIVARGFVSADTSASPLPLAKDSKTEYISEQSGTMSTWLLWNLSGTLEIGENEPPRTSVRSPFDAAIPILAAVTENESLEIGQELNCPEPDRAILGTAKRAWEKIT